MGLPLDLSADQVDRLFPFHLLVDRELTILTCGSVLARLLGEPPLHGSPLASHFRLHRPELALTPESLPELRDQLLILEAHQIPLQLKGQICSLEQSGLLLFVGTPWLTDLADLQKLGLKVKDFALQDSAVDFLFLLQARNVALAESQQLNTVLTEQRAELREAKQAAEAASSAKDTFLATMSHEIRTPMNAIMGMAGLLQETRLDEVQKEYVDIINNSTDSLLTIINDILDFSKIEAGSMELDRQAFDLGVCLEEALDLMASRAAERGLELILDLDPHLPTSVIGDRTRLRQILWNLLSNAAKFTPRGEIVVEVSGDGAEPPDGPGSSIWYRIDVRDTGIGIPADRLPHLFQPFNQGDPSIARHYGGTGLGLAITRRLCELMGGSIEVTSREGEGSRFTIVLPLEPDPEADTIPADAPLPGNVHVLVLAPGSTLRRVLRRQLESMGLAVTTADPTRQMPTDLQAGAATGAVSLVLADGRAFSLSQPGDEVGAWPEDARWRRVPWILLLDRTLQSTPQPLLAGRSVQLLSRPLRARQLRAALTRQLSGGSPLPNDTPAAPMTEWPSPTTLAERLPLRILVVDDIPVNQRLAVQLLKRLGYQAEVAASGEEAIRRVRQHPFDLIFMDVQMPGMDGHATTRAIRGLTDLPVRPWIIAMTAHARSEDRKASLAAGMDDFLSKPIAPADLAHAIDHYRPRPGGADAPGETDAGGSGSDEEPIDPGAWQELRTMLGDEADDGLRELVDLFLEDALRLVSAVVVAQRNGDGPAMITAVHSLRSPGASLGARRLAELCSTIEDTLRSPAAAWPQESIDELLLESGRVSEALRRLRPR